MIKLSLTNVYENLIDVENISIEIQLEAWRSILNNHINLGEKFCNPFRSDSNPDLRSLIECR